jgi:hypothetical protein
MMNNDYYNKDNNYDAQSQNMDRTECKRPSRGYNNYNKLNKTITIKNILEAYFAKAGVGNFFCKKSEIQSIKNMAGASLLK